MATESAMRMVESGGSRNWPPLKNMAAEELGSLLNGHSFRNDHSDIIPNRSGSAPPSMEGSFAAIADLLAKQNSGMESSMDSLRDALENCESEEELRSDPSYLAYYCSNVNLNPRLPPPLISRENRRLVRHIGASGNNWKSSSLYGRSSLSTHKEEPEDERSAGEDIFNTASAVARHKSLVDLIQEDFPRTPSPVFSMSRPSEPSDQDVNAISLDFSSVNISNVAESNSSSDICVNTSGHDSADDNKLKCNNNHLVTAVSSSPCHDSPQIEDPLPINAGLVDESGMPKPDLSRTESRMNKKQDGNHFQGRIMLQQYPSAQQGTPYHINSSVNNMSHGHAKFSSYEMRPSLQSPGLTSPLYTTAAAYMPSGNPFYPNYQPSGVYPPQYNASGYALNSALPPPLIGGYPSHGPMPLQFDATSVSTGANIRQSGNSQHQKFYGQQGLMLQPHSYLDPLHMQYLPPFGNVYGASARLASTGVTGPPQLDPSTQNDLLAAAYMGDQKLHSPTNGGLGVYDPRKLGVTVGSYYGGVPGMGLMPQFPSSPISSPVFPSSPIGGVSHFSRPNETRLPQVSNRNAQRGVGIFDDRKRLSFLEELKSSNTQKFELSDMAGRIVEFSVDQHGSRFIQQKLEHCSAEDKVAVFKEVLPHASKLMTDVFGNYVIQKFFEYGSPEQRKELADKLAGQMLPLSLQMYGCRVIQKALEVIELDQKSELVLELDGHVMKCVRDQNGNHVIQKCIECVPVENIQFIISAFRGQVATLSTHPYGCRVIQRILEHCSDGPQSQCIVDEILESAYVLAQDQYGNYVTQHVLERGKPHERSQIISQLTGKVVQLSQHKYASNVVEKCLEYGDAAERELLIQEIIGQSGDSDNLLTMMKDQFANYVVQKTLERCSDEHREKLINRIRVHCNALKKYTYGKHIVARFEQLYGESQEPESSPQA